MMVSATRNFAFLNQVHIASISGFGLLSFALLGPLAPSSQAVQIHDTEASSITTLSSSQEDLIAQWFYPESDRATVQVIGFAQVSQPADRVVLNLPFSPTYDDELPPDDFGWAEPDPLTQEELKPIVNALVAGGLDPNSVEAKIIPYQGGGFGFPFPSGSSLGGAVVIVTLEESQVAMLDRTVAIAEDATETVSRLELGAPQVSLELDNCLSLEQEAYQAAVANAQERAATIATSLNVELATPAISEPFYSPFLSSCYEESLSFFGEGSEPYVPGMDLSVELIKQLFFSYPIE